MLKATIPVVLILFISVNINAFDLIYKIRIETDTLQCIIDSTDNNWLYYTNPQTGKSNSVIKQRISQIIIGESTDKIVIPYVAFNKLYGTVIRINQENIAYTDTNGNGTLINRNLAYLCAFNREPVEDEVKNLIENFRYSPVHRVKDIEIEVEKTDGEKLAINKDWRFSFTGNIVSFINDEDKTINQFNRNDLIRISLFAPAYEFNKGAKMMIYDLNKSELKEAENIVLDEKDVHFNYIGKYYSFRTKLAKTDIDCIFLNEFPIEVKEYETILELNSVSSIFSKVKDPNKNVDILSVGIGTGWDFGGWVGTNLHYYPIKYLGLFGGIGYTPAGEGINLGAKIRYIGTNMPLIPHASYMYGSNAALVYTDSMHYNRIFEGHSIIIGFDTKPRYDKLGYFTLGLIIPFRSEEIDEYIDALNATNRWRKFKKDLFPVGISFGYKLILFRKE